MNPYRFSWPDLSISTRLTLWYGLTLLVILSLFAVFCYTSFHMGLHRDFDRHLTHEKRELLPLIEISESGPAFTSLSEARSVAYQTDGIYGTYVRLLSPEGDVLFRSPNFTGHAALPVQLPDGREETSVSRAWEASPARTHYVPLPGEQGALRGWLEVTGFEWTLHRELRRLGWTLALGILPGVLLAIGGGYVLARRALRPVSTLTETARQIGATDLGTRLPVRSSPRDELTRLAETFNDMIARLESSFERERRFTANAAHELLTPLTTMRSEIEVALRRDRNAEGYKDALQSVLTDAKEMAAIVRGLLQLSRAERLTGQHHEPVDLSALTTEHAERFRGRAGEEDIDLTLTVEPGAWARADAVRMGEVVDNLLDNAFKYTPAGGRVAVELEKTTEEVLLRILDTGVGFEPESAEHLYGRFYRGDAAEVQTQPGSGLGLAIVQAVVHAYGGEVSAESAGPDEGSTFEARLPLLPEADHAQSDRA